MPGCNKSQDYKCGPKYESSSTGEFHPIKTEGSEGIEREEMHREDDEELINYAIDMNKKDNLK